MKYLKSIIAIAILFTSSLFAQDANTIEEKLRLYEHENKGCPINSLCSKKSGALMLEWERILELENDKSRKKSKSLFFKNNGVPIHFLSKKSVSEKNDIILSASRCRVHNPKNPYNTLYKGTTFTTSIPVTDGMIFDPIVLLDEKKKVRYRVPYEGKPLFIKSGRLFFLEEFEDSFYQISIDQKGSIQLEDLPQRLFSQAQSKRISESPCPERKQDKEDHYHATYCQKIWDIDTNKMKSIQVFWSCP